MDKIAIKEALRAYVDRHKSAKAAAATFTGISSATVSQILNDNWELISDDMWRNVAAQIRYTEGEWVIAPTTVYQKLTGFLADAQRSPKGIDAIVINSSKGKSITLDHYSQTHPNTYYLCCTRLMNVRVILKRMLKVMGKDTNGTTIELMDNLVSHLQRESHPLFILDEVDKLKDEALEIFIDIENQLHKRCGLVFIATPYLKRRIDSGVDRGKRGFAELYSRMKRVFWDLNPDKKEFKKDVKAICTANGVHDEAVIAQFMNQCEGDYRVLADLVTAYKKSEDGLEKRL